MFSSGKCKSSKLPRGPCNIYKSNAFFNALSCALCIGPPNAAVGLAALRFGLAPGGTEDNEVEAEAELGGAEDNEVEAEAELGGVEQ